MKAAIAFLLLAVGVASAEDPKARFVADGKEQRTRTIKILKDDLESEKVREAAIKKAKPSNSPSGQSAYFSSDTNGKKTVVTFHCNTKQQQTEALNRSKARTEKLTKELDTATKAEYLTPELDPTRLEVGMVGIVTVERGLPVRFKTLQVVDADNVLIQFGGATHWLRTNTNGMVDGKLYDLKQVVHVKGTKQYKALVGTNTVLELVEFVPPK